MQALGIGGKQEGLGTACLKDSSASFVGWLSSLEREQFSSAGCVEWLSFLKRARFFKRQPIGGRVL
jgi:hypothetical protein